MSFRLVLVIGRASQYEVDCGPGFRWVLSTSNCSIGCGRSFCFTGRLPNVPSEVPRPDQFFYQELGFGDWFHGRGPCGNRTSGIDCVGPDSPSLVGAI